MTIKLLLIFIFMIVSSSAFGQFNEVEQQTVFGNRINNPIQIEMLTRADQVVFYASNSSFYPYKVVVDFDFIENLTPQVLFEDFIVYPGRKQIFYLTIVDKEKQPYIRYSYKYSIGDPRDTVMLNYPYLFPLRPDTKFDLLYSENKKVVIRDFFKFGKVDTIYCMRKGDVTATPNLYYKTERISKKEAVEIRHADGTVMIYENLNPNSVFVKAGNSVLPGDPIGVVDESLNLGVKLYSMNGDGSIKRQNINYAVTESDIQPFSEKFGNIKFQIPETIITKEMTKKEIKKFKKKK